MKLLIPLLLIFATLSFADQAGLGLVTGIEGNTIISYGELQTNFEGTRLVFVGPNSNVEIARTNLRFPFTASVIQGIPAAKAYHNTTVIRIHKFYEMKKGYLQERELD
jgi:hypothetical protein